MSIRTVSNKTQTYQMDKSAFSAGSPYDEGDERDYWRAKTPLERLEAIEFMRQVMYGYDPSTARLQRVIEFAKLERGRSGRPKDLGPRPVGRGGRLRRLGAWGLN